MRVFRQRFDVRLPLGRLSEDGFGEHLARSIALDMSDGKLGRVQSQT